MRFFFWVRPLYCVLYLLFFLNVAHSEIGYLTSQLRVQELFAKFKNSVVRVKAVREDTVDGKQKRFLKMGSGFFVSKDGHILTTGLLPNPDRVWVEFNKEYFFTEVIGSDSLCNLTLLKTLKLPKDFKYVSFSNNPKPVSPGTFLLGLTYALEFELSPNIGLMQSRESTFGRTLFPTKMLRSSLVLGPGEVGGPVFDLNGEFAGITHASLPDLSASFILPAKACSRIRDDLILSGSVDYGWFGITVSKKLSKENSFDIVIKSPGSNNKLQIGDILKKIGSYAIHDSGDILDSTFYSRPGTYVEFSIVREGKEMIIPVRVAPRSSISRKAEILSSSFDSNESNTSNITSEVITGQDVIKD